VASGRTSEVSKVALALAGSIALHIVVAIWLGHAAKVRASEPNKPVTVSVVEIEKPKPPPPPPPPPVEKPKPPPPTPVVRVLKPPPTKELPTPPPPNKEPPPAEKPPDAPPVILSGVTLESTAANGSFSVNTGNTLYGDPGTKGRDPSEVHPYKAARFVPAARVTEMPYVLNQGSVNIRKYYPADAKKNEFEGDVVLKLIIDSDGSIAKVTVISDPGQGLGEAAKKAIMEFKFSPGKVDGEAVATPVPFTMHFTLND